MVILNNNNWIPVLWKFFTKEIEKVKLILIKLQITVIKIIFYRILKILVDELHVKATLYMDKKLRKSVEGILNATISCFYKWC